MQSRLILEEQVGLRKRSTDGGEGKGRKTGREGERLNNGWCERAMYLEAPYIPYWFS